MCAYILTIDDEPQIRTMLSDALSSEGYEVGEASSAEQGRARIEARRPDLVILDVGMPGTDGITLCEQLRADPRYVDLPILFLTAFTQPEYIVRGLDAGGDDYTTKPIGIPVLMARVRAMLRRATRSSEDGTEDTSDENRSIIRVGRLTLNSDTYQIEADGRTSQLTATEHRLLRYMMLNANQPLAPQHLLEAVWEYPPYTGDPDLVRVHVRNLRAKIEHNPRQPEFIQTVHGVGYTLAG